MNNLSCLTSKPIGNCDDDSISVELEDVTLDALDGRVDGLADALKDVPDPAFHIFRRLVDVALERPFATRNEKIVEVVLVAIRK